MLNLFFYCFFYHFLKLIFQALALDFLELNFFYMINLVSNTGHEYEMLAPVNIDILF